MRNLKFHYLQAKNILCFGPEGVEFRLDQYGQIVQIIGINLDYQSSSNIPASNAAGKSSIQELLSIGLYGRTVKSPTKNSGATIVNALATSGSIDVRWDDYRVLRTYKRGSSSVSCDIKLWKSSDHIWDDKTQIIRNSEETKAEIERALGLTHHAFCNVVIFDDSNTYSFLESDTDSKRTIVENLLDLDQYRQYHKNCKELIKEFKLQIDSLTKTYTTLSNDVDACSRRIASVEIQDLNWRNNKKQELQTLKSQIEALQAKLQNLPDEGKLLIEWNNSRERIAVLSDEINDLQSKRTKLESIILTAKGIALTAEDERSSINELISSLRIDLMTAKKSLESNLQLILSLESNKDGTVCPNCYGVINRNNYGEMLAETRIKSDQVRDLIASKEAAINLEKEKLVKKNSSITMMTDKLNDAQQKVSSLDSKIKEKRAELDKLSKLSKPQGSVAAQVLESQIVSAKQILKQKTEESQGNSPYEEILQQARLEKETKEADKEKAGVELKQAEAEMPYYQFWLEAFGDKGIRKFVIDGIIPALNERVAYWMQILTSGLIEIEFDNQLNQTIKRHNNPASYFNMSNGEKRRVNLAVSQAFSYVMTLNSGTCPSIVFLDEVTGGGIDRAGIPSVHNMIFELAKERQVFVTTHNETLMSLLEGCQTITLKKQNDLTSLVP